MIVQSGLVFRSRDVESGAMILKTSLRSASLALVLLAASAAQAQSGRPGVPSATITPPGPVGVPGGRMGNTATSGVPDGSVPSDADRPKSGRGDKARPAKAEELKVGADILDSQGADVGYIKAIDPDGVVVSTVGGQVKVPADAFGMNKKGLLIGMKKADFDKLVASANGG